ncbi:MAG: ATP-binding cassette domain-containing protein [Acidimicrobiales bacterium]|nr:ATP-binding cassette domain-containing protein [Acidimicrobiales bacterium]
MRSKSLLELANLTRRYGGVVAVDNLTMDVETGEICGLLGPNGAGKTTLVNLISGFTTPSNGTIRYGGEDIDRVGQTTRSRMGLVRTFQHARTFATMTVRESLSVAGTVPAGHHRVLGFAWTGVGRQSAEYAARPRRDAGVVQAAGLERR